MSRGKPACDTSIRPQRTLSERRGGGDIAECEQNGIQLTSDQRQIRRLEDTGDFSNVEEVSKVVDDNEEITSPEEEEAE